MFPLLFVVDDTHSLLSGCQLVKKNTSPHQISEGTVLLFDFSTLSEISQNLIWMFWRFHRGIYLHYFTVRSNEHGNSSGLRSPHIRRAILLANGAVFIA
tara:strand:+ start:1997 stop:2293 length:297 start_codon:yes stop_codon:yes gene_type:complete